MTKSSLSDIRKEFLDFFSKRGHEEITSSSLVPYDDDSLLFTNAGMVQFKNFFTGLSTPPKSKKQSLPKNVSEQEENIMIWKT